MQSEEDKEIIESRLLLHGFNKYPKEGLVKPITDKLESIGFMRISELYIGNNSYGSIWVCCGNILAIKRMVPGDDDSILELVFFDNSSDAKHWVK